MIMRSLLTLMITATLTAQVSPRDQFTITDPSRALWKQIKDALLAEGGERYFEEGVKGALIPGGARRVTRFRGKVLAARPEAKPTELMVAILDPEVPDVNSSSASLGKEVPRAAQPSNSRASPPSSAATRSSSPWTLPSLK